MPSLDFVDQLLRFAFGWNEIKPAAGDHELLRQSQHPVGDGIAMVMIAEEPGVEVAFAKGSLDGGKFHKSNLMMRETL